LIVTLLSLGSINEGGKTKRFQLKQTGMKIETKKNKHKRTRITNEARPFWF